MLVVLLAAGALLASEGDPLITSEERSVSEGLGRFASIRSARKDERGIWGVVHDLRLKTAGTRFSANILHGVEPCGVKPQS